VAPGVIPGCMHSAYVDTVVGLAALGNCNFQVPACLPCPAPTQVLLLLLRCAPSASAMLPKFYGVLTMRRSIEAPGPHMSGADLPPQAIANLKMPPLCPAAGTEHQWRPRNQAELLQPALRSHQRWVD